jgi:hypothetical protein
MADLLFWPKGSLRWSTAFWMGPLPVTQACTAKPRAASMPSLQLRTCAKVKACQIIANKKEAYGSKIPNVVATSAHK